GVFACVLTLRTTRPEKRPHRSGALTFTFSWVSCAGGTGSNVGCFSGAPVSAASSRATPYTDSACARLGVSLSVNTWSSSCRTSALGCCTACPISPTTSFVNGGATGRRSSTSRPPMVSVSAICCVLRGGLQNSRSQDSGNCIVLGFGLAELAQEADVAVEVQA